MAASTPYVEMLLVYGAVRLSNSQDLPTSLVGWERLLRGRARRIWGIVGTAITQAAHQREINSVS